MSGYLETLPATLSNMKVSWKILEWISTAHILNTTYNIINSKVFI